MNNKNKIKFEALCRYNLRIKNGVALSDDSDLKKLGAADWSLIDLATSVEEEFGIALNADEAINLSTVKAWHDLIDAKMK